MHILATHGWALSTPGLKHRSERSSSIGYDMSSYLYVLHRCFRDAAELLAFTTV